MRFGQLVDHFGLDPASDRINPYGGAIALGHPLGSSGSRLVVTLLGRLEREDARYGLATMCVGAITTADQVNTIVAAGRADLVALARPHLADPAFTMKAAAWYGAKAVACPPQYRAGRDQLFRESDRAAKDLTELKLKARPKAHATTWKQAAE